MHRYAQINSAGMCVSILQLAEEVEDANLILLEEDEEVNIRDIWDGEKWTPAAPLPEPEPQPDRIEQLEAENALIALELAETQMRLDQSEQAHADLLLTLVQGGVI